MVEKIGEYIRKVFRRELQNSYKWIEKKSKATLLKKLDAMKLNIGYPKDILDDSAVMRIYGDYTRFTSDFGEDLFNIIKRALRDRLNIVDEKRKTHWKSSVIPSAYYMPYNEVYLLGAIMNKPTFELSYPGALKFGGIGYILAHEMLHGFDLYGTNRNFTGSLMAPTIGFSSNFASKLHCFIKQYNKFTYAGRNLVGTLTLAEDLVDNGAVSLTYKAYQDWKSENPKEIMSLPGIGNLTDDQLMFVQMASLHCERIRPELASYKSISKAHSPARFRIIGPLSNSPDFANVWQCKEGSKMNPTEPRCKIW